jgi:hypothetical protein
MSPFVSDVAKTHVKMSHQFVITESVIRLLFHQTVNYVLYDNCKGLTSMSSYVYSSKSVLVASFNYSHGIGIGNEDFWIQENILRLGLFLEKLFDEKKKLFHCQ